MRFRSGPSPTIPRQDRPQSKTRRTVPPGTNEDFLPQALGTTYRLETVNGAAIHCLVCGRTSYNINDVKNRYCGCCSVFHDQSAGRCRACRADPNDRTGCSRCRGAGWEPITAEAVVARLSEDDILAAFPQAVLHEAEARGRSS